MPASPELLGELSYPSVPVDAAKLSFVRTVASSIVEGPVNLSLDLSGYGEGGWHTASGSLSGEEAAQVALHAWYGYVGALQPPAHLVVQESHFLTYGTFEVVGDAMFPPPLTASGRAALDSTLSELSALESELAGWGWSEETGTAGYGALSRSAGQCVPTALLVQERFGGDLLRYELEDGSHYANWLPNRRIADLTRDQFSSFRPVGPPALRERSALLANPDVAARYEQLRSNLTGT